WLLRGTDGRRGVGKAAAIPAATEREGWAAACSADELQGICFKRLPSAAPQEMEGLNRSDNHRTYNRTFVSGIRGLRAWRSDPRSAAEAPRCKDPFRAVEERRKPPSAGFERDLQDGL